MDKVPAMILPFVCSIVLYFVYLGTKRSSDIERDREIAREAEKELKVCIQKPFSDYVLL